MCDIHLDDPRHGLLFCSHPARVAGSEAAMMDADDFSTSSRNGLIMLDRTVGVLKEWTRLA